MLILLIACNLIENAGGEYLLKQLEKKMKELDLDNNDIEDSVLEDIAVKIVGKTTTS